MIYQGRGGMWDDWLKFQSDMKKSREEEERQKKLAKAKRKKIFINGLIIASAIVGTTALVVAGIYFLLTFGR